MLTPREYQSTNASWWACTLPKVVVDNLQRILELRACPDHPITLCHTRGFSMDAGDSVVRLCCHVVQLRFQTVWLIHARTTTLPQLFLGAVECASSLAPCMSTAHARCCIVLPPSTMHPHYATMFTASNGNGGPAASLHM